MRFRVVDSTAKVRSSQANTVYLIKGNWDDWFEFQTVHEVYYVTEDSTTVNLGAVKIGEYDMPRGQRSPELPKSCPHLPSRFFSLGQDDSYYEILNSLGPDFRDEFLESMNDLAWDEAGFEKAKAERVTKISLLRDISPESVTGLFRRLARGDGDQRKSYDFTYSPPKHPRSTAPDIKLSFHVEPKSNPPTNIHVLIGRNGVGKTFLLENMIGTLIDDKLAPSKKGVFSSEVVRGKIFAGVVSVTFSAFDLFDPPTEKRDKTKGIKFDYIGLKRLKTAKEPNPPPKTPLILKNEFVSSVENCFKNGRTARWRKALEMLEADTVFAEADVSTLADIRNYEDRVEQAATIFNGLSSGHKIVLLTITRLIETLEERTLVLIDEPEAHLHPPLLSAFVRTLSKLLVVRNGVAIIATHSPVVLQEVPKSCSWTLRRNGNEAFAERLEIESFGENVGSLTRAVFALELTHSGFHKMLSDAVARFNTYDRVLEHFNSELGAEAKAIVRALMLTKNLEEE